MSVYSLFNLKPHIYFLINQRNWKEKGLLSFYSVTIYMCVCMYVSVTKPQGLWNPALIFVFRLKDVQRALFSDSVLKYVFVISIVLFGIKYPKTIDHTLWQWCYLIARVLNRENYEVTRDVITKSWVHQTNVYFMHIC